MRLYAFINFYLSSIQQGIQTAHVEHELFNKYGFGEVTRYKEYLQLERWSKNHKTIITLNGGNNKSLHELVDFFDDLDNMNPYPFASFYEDEDSLGGIMTGVGIVVPEKIYDAAEKIRRREWEFVTDGEGMLRPREVFTKFFTPGPKVLYSNFEVELIDRMNACPLAR